jgi:hypothetical protein
MVNELATQTYMRPPTIWHHFWHFVTGAHLIQKTTLYTTPQKKKKPILCICIKIFANTKIIDFNHVWKSVPLGLHNRNNVDIKIKLIRYDPNCVPCFFFLNSTTCIFAVLYDIYVLDLHWRQSFVYITNVYFKQWPSEFRVIFGIRKCA